MPRSSTGRQDADRQQVVDDENRGGAGRTVQEALRRSITILKRDTAMLDE